MKSKKSNTTPKSQECLRNFFEFFFIQKETNLFSFFSDFRTLLGSFVNFHPRSLMDLGENGDGLTLGLTNSGTPFLKKSPHTCAVCNFTFKTESQLFNHLDNCGLRRKYEHLIL